jgi:SulP family sulfate permease
LDHRPARVLVPKLVTTLKTYDRSQLVADLTAGLTVGIVAVPLAIAFAIASGLSPERGLYTAVVAGFLISALGGSRVQIGGPTGAFVVIVSGVVQQHGVDGLLVATLLAGALLVAFGLFRFGAAIKFIPYPVTIGFTTGIALIIFSGQVPDLLGLDIPTAPTEFVERWRTYGERFDTLNPWTLAVGTSAFGIMLAWPRLSRRVPGSIIAIVVTAATVQLLHLPVETIGERFGAIDASLPSPAFPSITLPMVTELVGPAFTIAMLAGIESLLSAVVADGMTGGRHRSNMELVAQGVANLTSPLFGGLPATGAIARTATNVKNGGRTPVAGMTHAVTVLLATLFFGRLVGAVPLATLAAILTTVAFHMSEWRTFVAEFRGAPKSDVAVMLTTFLLTVLVDLTVAIEAGMVLAAFLFMRRMAEVTNIAVITHEFRDPATDFEGDPNWVGRRAIPPGVEVYEITGPFFFGAAETFKDRLRQIAGKPKVLILRMRHVLTIDATGLHALRDLVRRSRRDGTVVVLSDIHMQPVVALQRSGLYDEIGEDNLHGNIDDALNRARKHLGLETVARPADATPTVARETGSFPRP